MVLNLATARSRVWQSCPNWNEDELPRYHCHFNSFFKDEESFFAYFKRFSSGNKTTSRSVCLFLCQSIFLAFCRKSFVSYHFCGRNFGGKEGLEKVWSLPVVVLVPRKAVVPSLSGTTFFSFASFCSPSSTRLSTHLHLDSSWSSKSKCSKVLNTSPLNSPPPHTHSTLKKNKFGIEINRFYRFKERL